MTPRKPESAREHDERIVAKAVATENEACAAIVLCSRAVPEVDNNTWFRMRAKEAE